MGKSRDFRGGKIRVLPPALPLTEYKTTGECLQLKPEFLNQGALPRMCCCLVFGPYPETGILGSAFLLLTLKGSPAGSPRPGERCWHWRRPSDAPDQHASGFILFLF